MVSFTVLERNRKPLDTKGTCVARNTGACDKTQTSMGLLQATDSRAVVLSAFAANP